MGGPGSGYFGPRPGAKRTTDDFLKLDVNALSRSGALIPGAAHDLRWVRNGRTLTTVTLTAADDVLTYTGRRSSNLTIERTPYYYGGARAWRRCPMCARRAEVLYLASASGCRASLNLTCAVCREQPHVRALRRDQKLTEWLDGGRMRLRTYECLSHERVARAEYSEAFEFTILRSTRRRIL
jgi:hypothetical protein